MADKEFRTVTAEGRIVYNLDAVTTIATKTLASTNQLALQSTAAALVSALPNMSAVFKAFEPMRRMVEVIQESFKKTLEAIKTMIQAIVQRLQYLLNWPLIYVTPPTVVGKRLDRHLTASVNPHGFFVFGGRTIFRLHSRTSRVGRFLHCLLLAVSEVVTYEEIQEHIGSGDRKKAFKDLKYKLKKEGYKLDYTLVRTEGIALKGVLAIH